MDHRLLLEPLTYIAVISATGLYTMVEMYAMRRWKRWAYHGITIFRRRELLDERSGYESLKDVIASGDPELAMVGLRFKEVSPGSYLVQMPMGKYVWPGATWFWSIVAGQMMLNREAGEIQFRMRIMVGPFVILASGFVECLVYSIRAGSALDALFLIMFALASGWIGFNILIRRRLVDFWFLLTTKLAILVQSP